MKYEIPGGGEMAIAQDLYDDISAYLARSGVKRDVLTPDASLGDIGVDSLELLALSQELEKKYQVSLDDERIASVRTLSDLVDFVTKAQLEQAG